MIFDYKDIKYQLESLGLKKNDKFIVHTSLKSIGEMKKGAETLFEAFLSVISDEGTIMAPGLSYMNVNKENPVFDVLNTPVCVGAFPEFFRHQKGVIRSIHPTHSVLAYGKDSEKLTKNHISDNTPAGENSPFRLLSKCKGKILMLGCGLCPNTSMHSVEELCPPNYLYKNEKIEYTLTDYERKEHKAFHIPHGFENVSAQRYDRITDFLNDDEIKEGMVGNAKAYLIDSESMFLKCAKVLKEHPLYFVDMK